MRQENVHYSILIKWTITKPPPIHMYKWKMYIYDHMSKGRNVELYIRSLPVVQWQGGVQRGRKGEKKGKMNINIKKTNKISLNSRQIGIWNNVCAFMQNYTYMYTKRMKIYSKSKLKAILIIIKYLVIYWALTMDGLCPKHVLTH